MHFCDLITPHMANPEGVFTEHSVAEWAEDAAAVVAAVQTNSGDLILIGSSMGGWISLNLGRDMGDRLRGLILIAAAPDFTEDSMLASFTEAQKQEIAEQGVTYIPSDYGDPYPISNHLLTDSRRADCHARSAGFWMPRSHGAGNIGQCSIT